MARSLLRAGQIRDEDNLTEYEHDVLVHENLVTSGTLNFQNGTISGTGDVYAGSYYGDGANLTGIDTTTLSGIILSQTYETTITAPTTTITLDFEHDNYGVSYIDGVRQQAEAYLFSGTDQIVFDETLPSGTKMAFTHLVADDTNDNYYTKEQVNTLIATVSGALQAQIDAL